MIGELGLFSLVLVACLSSIICVAIGWKRQQNSPIELSTVRSCTQLSALFSIVSIVLLGFAFYIDDFSISYVAAHSNTELPIFFKLAAVWGGHEGSLLFWVLTLGCWSGLITLNRRYPRAYLINVLWVMNGLIAVFAWFTLIASNPFVMSSMIPVEGRDLNPMLQDVGLIFHPPLLYLGYVGLSTVLAFAVAALLTPEIEYNWVKYCQPWCQSAWVFLTGGIILGSWWAYYELGWGGWWFWDPVENASLLPWLTSTALLHCLSVARYKRQLMKWAFSLSFITFSLSILGTFIVRSGVLTSVHAFAVDPGKGLTLLLILSLVLFGSFCLLLARGDEIKSESITHFLSKSFVLLLANSLLIVAMIVVLVGTFYPMLFSLLGLGNISVGAPYFNTVFSPLALIALFIMGASPFISYYKQRKNVKQVVIITAIASIVVGVLLYQVQVEYSDWLVQLTWIIGVWVVLSHLYLLKFSLATSGRARSIAVNMAHIGVAVVCIGSAMNSEHSYELNRRMAPGTEVVFADWAIKHLDTELYIGPNYTSEKIWLEISGNNRTDIIIPERRHYQVRVMNMSEPAMKWFWHGDIYVTVGEKVDLKSYAVRIQYKAYVRWIWLGALLSTLGVVLLLVQPKRSRENQQKTNTGAGFAK